MSADTRSAASSMRGGTLGPTARRRAPQATRHVSDRGTTEGKGRRGKAGPCSLRPQEQPHAWAQRGAGGAGACERPRTSFLQAVGDRGEPLKALLLLGLADARLRLAGRRQRS